MEILGQIASYMFIFALIGAGVLTLLLLYYTFNPEG